MHRVVVRADGLHLQRARPETIGPDKTIVYDTIIIFDRVNDAIAAYFAEVSTTGDVPMILVEDAVNYTEGEETFDDLPDDFYAPEV